jgi:RNA polymerase sigma factor (sigma-70 family)
MTREERLKLFEDHQWMVYYAMKKFYSPSTSPFEAEDALQVAFMELWQYTERFDPSLGFGFSTLGLIRLKAAIRDRDHHFRPGKRAKLVSLDSPIPASDDKNITYGDLIADPKDYTEYAIAEATVNDILSKLSDEGRLITERLMDDWTQAQVAEVLNCTQMTVSRRRRKIGLQIDRLSRSL